MHTLRISRIASARWPVVAFVVWAILVLVTVGRAALYYLPGHIGCYWIYADAARHWAAGTDLYLAREGLDVFRYGPLVAALLAPLAALPDALGSALLRLLNAAVYLSGLAWWMRAALPHRLSSGQRAALFLLVVPLSVSSVVDVQTNALTIGLLLLTVAAAAEDRWNLASICVALACIIKAYPIALALLLAAAFPRRFAGRLLLALTACLGLPFLLQRPEYVLQQYQGWIHWGLNSRYGADMNTTFRDLRLLCAVWFTPLSNSSYLVVQLLTAAVIAVLCVLERRAPLSRRRLLTTLLGLSCCWMMLLGPATESTTYILLAPTLAWVVLEAWIEPRGPFYRAVVAASFLLFTATQVVLWFPHGNQFHKLAPHPIAALALAGALVASELQRLARATQPVDAAPCLPAESQASLTQMVS
jgi:hypothetical protein